MIPRFRIEEKPELVSAFVFDQEAGKLKVLNQTLLPRKIEYVDVPDSERGYSVIREMIVRGAPCIAAVGCISIIAELNLPKIRDQLCEAGDVVAFIEDKSFKLIGARPTAVNLKKALDKLVFHAKQEKPYCKTAGDLIDRMTDLCGRAIESGQNLNIRLGDYGAQELLSQAKDSETKLTVLTHCNTGSLATVGYGTALGVIRSLDKEKRLKQAFCTETRPYNQGSRLTALELVQDRIPATLIADSMVAYLMATHQVDAVVVGADCVAANGDTANKIGTLQIAVLAKHYGVAFYVAAPSQSIDLSKEDQSRIEIEQRPPSELRRLDNIVLAPDEVDVWNPCFDVTPAELITGIITEFGVCTPGTLRTNIRLWTNLAKSWILDMATRTNFAF